MSCWTQKGKEMFCIVCPTFVQQKKERKNVYKPLYNGVFWVFGGMELFPCLSATSHLLQTNKVQNSDSINKKPYLPLIIFHVFTQAHRHIFSHRVRLPHVAM